MISYEPLPSAIGPSHQMQQQSMTSTQLQQPTQQQQQQQLTQQQQFLQQQQQLHQQQMQQQHYQHQGNNGDSNNPLDYELDASSSAEEIWDLDSHTVKRYNNASGDTTSSASGGHGSMESPLGSYGELPPPHYVPTNAMWGPGNIYPQQTPQHPQQPTPQHGFPSGGAPHDMYGSGNDWLHAGAGGPPPNSLKRPASGGPGEEAKRIKTYQCEACDKWFTSSGHLKRHFNTTLHKNATRHQHKSGGSPRIGTPAGVMDLGDNSASATSISNLNSSTSTLNSSPSPSSPHHLSSNHATSIQQVTGGGPPTLPMGPGGVPGAGGHNNNVPNSPRSFYSNRSSPAMGQGSSPAKMHMMASPMGANPGVKYEPGVQVPPGQVPPQGGMMSPMRPLPSMKESLSHINNDLLDTKPPVGQDTNPVTSSWGGPMMAAPHMQVRSGYSNLYSPDSVSAVNRSTYAGTTSDTSSVVMTTSDYTMNSADLYQLQPPQQQQQLQPQPQQQQNFSYHGHYNATSMDYTHTNGGSMNSAYMMYGHQQRAGPGGYLAHPSDMSSGYGHSEGSVKDELDQLSVATGDLDEGLSETGTPATPTDSLEGPPTPRGPPLTGNGSGGNVAPQPPGQGDYRCNECNKSFNRLCYLKQHNKSFHNGEKPFKCGQCGKRFPVEMLYQVRVIFIYLYVYIRGAHF